MLKAETRVIATDYDFEEVRTLSVSYDCGAKIHDDVLEALSKGERESYVCACGKTVQLAELDAYADSLISPVPHVDD